MNIDEFWELIEKTLKKKHIPRMQESLLVMCLSELSGEDIVDCYNIFSQLERHAGLNSLRAAAGIIGDGIGSDGFSDFCGWLIVQGKDIYCAAIQNPETLVDYVSLEKRQETKYEAFIYGIAEAYENKTGQRLNYELLQTAKQRIQMSLDEIAKYPRDTNDYYDKSEAEIYPKLWSKFGREETNITIQDIFSALEQLSADELEQVQEDTTKLQPNLSQSDSTVVGIIGDMHGNYEGFLKALEIFEQHGVMQILCAGDIVDRGGHADDIVKMIRARNILCIAGNHDRTVVTNQARWRASKNAERLRELGRIVSDETITFLKALPDTAEIIIADKRILIAHGAPWSDVITVFPDSRQSTFERINNDYGGNYDIVILGHTHQPMHARIGNLHILNAGSVYDVTIRDSHTCGILYLPETRFVVFDLASENPIDLGITEH